MEAAALTWKIFQSSKCVPMININSTDKVKINLKILDGIFEKVNFGLFDL